MKTKLIGIFICMLLIATAIPVIGQVKNISIIRDDNVANPTNNGDKWTKTYDFTFYDNGESVQQTSDGGYIVIGYTNQLVNDANIFLLKTDSMGNKQWGKTFGGNNMDYASNVKQTSDGGYIIVGSTAYFSNGELPFSDIWLIKTDSNGNMEWDKRFGSSGYDGSGTDVIELSDGSYILLGVKHLSDTLPLFSIWVIKTDINGNLVWDKTFSKESKSCYGRIMKKLNDGGYIIAGSIRYPSDLYLLKINSEGILQWEKSFNRNKYEYCNSLDTTSDGGFIILGNTCNDLPYDDVWLVKTDSEGELQWDKTYDVGDDLLEGASVQTTSDGGFIIGGWYWYNRAGTDGFLLKTNDTGEQEWFKTYHRTFWNYVHSAQQTTDGGYILTGVTDEVSLPLRTDVWLIKTDKNGDAPPGKSRDLWRSRLFELFPNLFLILRHLLRL
jgi:hypothetical protein